MVKCGDDVLMWMVVSGCQVSSKSSAGNKKNSLLFFFFFFLFFFLIVLFGSITATSVFSFLTLWCLWVSSLLAWPLAEPLGQSGLGSLGPFVVLLLPAGLQHLGSDNLPSTFVQLLTVDVGSCVGTSLVLGEHADLGRVLAGEGLGIETLLDGLVSQLNLLSLLQLLEFIVLGKLTLFIIVFVSLQGEDGVPQISGLGLQLVRVHGVKVEGLDSDAERDLHLLLDLFLGLGHLSSGIKSGSLLFLASLLLLCSHHFLSLSLCFFQPLLFFCLLGFLLSLLFPQLVLFFLLLCGKLLLLLSSDLLSLGLLLLHLLELLFLLVPLFSPLIDVLPQLFVQLSLFDSGLGLGKGLIPLLGGVGPGLLLIILVVRHTSRFQFSPVEQLPRRETTPH